MKIFGICLLLFIALTSNSYSKEIKIAIDENRWFPYTFVDNQNKPSGVHVDIVNQALVELGYTPVWNFYPWKRCLYNAENGDVDMIVSSSYKKERTDYLQYPPDASTAKKSEWRVTLAEKVVVVTASSNYEFNGDAKSLPEPVRVPLGYATADQLINEGLHVETATKSLANLRKLLRDNSGCAIMVPTTANYYLQNPEFKGKLKINKTPLTSKSYFAVFSNKTLLSKAAMQIIWDKIAEVRDRDGYLMNLFEKY